MVENIFYCFTSKQRKQPNKFKIEKHGKIKGEMRGLKTGDLKNYQIAFSESFCGSKFTSSCFQLNLWKNFFMVQDV